VLHKRSFITVGVHAVSSPLLYFVLDNERYKPTNMIGPGRISALYQIRGNVKL